MLRVYYEADALFVDGRPEAIVAATLVASVSGDIVSITSRHRTDPLVSAPFTVLGRADGSSFDSAADCLAYLAGEFARSATSSAVFAFSSPANPWPIIHDLGRRPRVMVVDDDGNEVIARVRHFDINVLEVGFALPFSGTAYLS